MVLQHNLNQTPLSVSELPRISERASRPWMKVTISTPISSRYYGSIKTRRILIKHRQQFVSFVRESLREMKNEINGAKRNYTNWNLMFSWRKWICLIRCIGHSSFWKYTKYTKNLFRTISWVRGYNFRESKTIKINFQTIPANGNDLVLVARIFY